MRKKLFSNPEQIPILKLRVISPSLFLFSSTLKPHQTMFRGTKLILYGSKISNILTLFQGKRRSIRYPIKNSVFENKIIKFYCQNGEKVVDLSIFQILLKHFGNICSNMYFFASKFCLNLTLPTKTFKWTAIASNNMVCLVTSILRPTDNTLL